MQTNRTAGRISFEAILTERMGREDEVTLARKGGVGAVKELEGRVEQIMVAAPTFSWPLRSVRHQSLRIGTER